MAPGIPFESGGAAEIALFNSGGVGAPPLWVISPLVVIFISLSLIKRQSRFILEAAALLGGAVFLNSFHIQGHGAVAHIWSQDLLIYLSLIMIPVLLKEGEEIIPTLRMSRVGRVHITSAIILVALLISSLISGFWIVGSGSTGVVRGDQTSVAPAFIGALATTPARPKTMMLSISGTSTQYFISRGSELSLGDADVATPIPTEIDDAMSQLVTGSGVTSSKILGQYGIQYLFIKSPVPVPLASLIDGIGGFARVSATPSGTMWKILGANPRVLFSASAGGAQSAIDSSALGAAGSINGAGTITLAEKYDTNWRLLLDGQSVPLHRSVAGEPEFLASDSGKVLLSYDGTAHRALLSLQFIALLLTLVMALPYGRTRNEVPLEELV
jgi:hypothetical protein